MNTNDYVSYPIALALKKAGFDWPCDHYYCAFDNETDVRFWNIHPAQSQNGLRTPNDTVVADAPTLAVAQKWLREKKRMVIVVTPETDMADFNDIPKEFLTGEWCYEIWVDDDTHRYGMESHSFYEQALSAGITSALELIEKKGE